MPESPDSTQLHTTQVTLEDRRSSAPAQSSLASAAFNVASAAPSIVSSAPDFFGSAASSAFNVAVAAASNAPSSVSSAVASVSNAVGSTDAARTAGQSLLTAVTSLADTVSSILSGTAANVIPTALISDFVKNTDTFASSIDALAKVVAAGVSQSNTSYLESMANSIALTTDSLTAEIQKLQGAGSGFNGRYQNNLTMLYAKLNGLLSGNNTAITASATSGFSTAVAAH
ncbi:hypothetical protein B0H10DRAFT_1945777 [Mycena sp. CBHHK59/15]|nr:hypothetical protein B0H10DRAFT_1945777 [Mycena sp. CBHHK59/15]